MERIALGVLFREKFSIIIDGSVRSFCDHCASSVERLGASDDASSYRVGSCARIVEQHD